MCVGGGVGAPELATDIALPPVVLADDVDDGGLPPVVFADDVDDDDGGVSGADGFAFCGGGAGGSDFAFCFWPCEIAAGAAGTGVGKNFGGAGFDALAGTGGVCMMYCVAWVAGQGIVGGGGWGWAL